MKTLFTIIAGLLFGAVLIYSEAFQWNRIDDMFHFRSFHMFGLLFSAILTGALSLLLIKRLKVRSFTGNEVKIKQKERKPYGNAIGGLIFGAGWAITGACTAPIFILIGFNWYIGLIVFVGAIGGVCLYAFLKERLPE